MTHNLVLLEKLLGPQLVLGKDLLDYFSSYLKKNLKSNILRMWIPLIFENFALVGMD